MKVVRIVDYEVVSVYNWAAFPPELVGDLSYKILAENEQHVTLNWRYIDATFLPPLDSSNTFGRIITKLAFRRRFNGTERRAIKKASLGLNNSLTEDQWLDIASALDDLLAAGYVHLDRPETVSFVQALQALTLVAGGRATEILSPPVWSLELLAESRVMFGLPPVPTDIEMVANGGKGYSTVGQFKADHPN